LEEQAADAVGRTVAAWSQWRRTKKKLRQGKVDNIYSEVISLKMVH
jgi:3'-phosphoadenosine 5'-phosphosulfate sulfotransferase